MFRTLSVALSIMLLYLLSLPATADSDPRRQTVARMGELNGVALACRYFDQTRRMKRILIDHLPKERSLGQLFDDRTNQSFLAFVDSGRGCPSPAQFAGEVDQAEQALIQAYDPEGDKPGR
jgi:hypothetical protein